MVSSAPQLPPRPSAAHTVTGDPPATAAFFREPPAKKATHWPSGEKNGSSAPSDSGTSTDCVWSRARNARRWLSRVPVM
jgi:hypothetical protein